MYLSLSISYTFKYFQTAEVYLEPIQIFKIELFVKIANSLMLLTILTKSSILDVWLGSTKSFNKSFFKFNIFKISSDLVKYFFPFTLIFISSNIRKRSSEAITAHERIFMKNFTHTCHSFYILLSPTLKNIKRTNLWRIHEGSFYVLYTKEYTRKFAYNK